MNNLIIEALKQLGGTGTFAQIYEITKIFEITLHRLLRTMCKRGELVREFVVAGFYRNGDHKRNFVYSLPSSVISTRE